MAQKKYKISENEALMVADTTTTYGITIPVTVPTMGGYTFEALKRELNEFARKLVNAQPATAEECSTDNCPTKHLFEDTYIKPLNQLDPSLQELCGICHVDESDLNGDKAREMILEGV